MSLLLDTHALLWALSAPARLSTRVRELLERPDTAVLVHVVSAWEMEVKRALGKLDCTVTHSTECSWPRPSLMGSHL